ncbi:hypothetical protein [Streptomyces sp. NPDC058256]|uniref:hypothetical protein n=1 Tax=Streptomyces sp. NPDC058256 TaxID=3346408 RepID=UPI0036EE02A3
MEVHIEATLDERSAGSRGDAFARWFRVAVDSFFPDPSAFTFSDIANLETGLRRNLRKSLRESRSYLRGYAWVTGVPSEPGARLGGRQRLAATGAFHRVEELRSGGLLLQATETLAGYSDHAMRGIFAALAPVLPPGIPREDPAHPEMRLVFEDASGV